VLLVFLQLVGVVTPQALLGAWRYAIVGTFVLAAVITPSGVPFSLLALSLPLVLLYFVAVLIGWFAQRAKRRREATAG
jgi:sec-independent protein translocase protein TatC